MECAQQFPKWPPALLLQYLEFQSEFEKVSSLNWYTKLKKEESEKAIIVCYCLYSFWMRGPPSLTIVPCMVRSSIYARSEESERLELMMVVFDLIKGKKNLSWTTRTGITQSLLSQVTLPTGPQETDHLPRMEGWERADSLLNIPGKGPLRGSPLCLNHCEIAKCRYIRVGWRF